MSLVVVVSMLSLVHSHVSKLFMSCWMKGCNAIVFHGIIFENMHLGGDVSEGNWWHLGTDLTLQSPNAGKEMGRKEGDLKLLSLGCPMH